MWMFLVINYLTDVLGENVKIEIKMISYGMFEARENGITPIVNLKSFYDLMKWIKGANAFKQYGNTYEFLDMIEDDRLRNTLEEFSNSMNMNYIWNIKENIGKINKIEETIKTLDGPAELLLPDILERFVENFGKRQETFEMLLSLAEWHYNQKRYSMSFVNIIEAIYTFVGKILEIEDINNKAKERIREWIDEISEENKMNYKNLLEEEINNRIELREIFETFRVIRNSISHTLENKSEMQEIISKIPQNIEKLRKIFEMEYKKNGISKPKDLNLNQTYTLLENLAEEGEFKEVGRIASNGIYDFLFKTLNVEKSSENKNFVKNWLDSKKENFGKRIERMRLAQKISRQEFCGDESELSVRQLIRIERGESRPTLTKLKYIANRLGIEDFKLMPDYVELEKDYLQLKYYLMRTPTYEDENIAKEKEKIFDKIFDKYYDDLPEEERIIIDILQAYDDFGLQNDDSNLEMILQDYFTQILIKTEYEVNELLIIKLFLLRLVHPNTLLDEKEKHKCTIIANNILQQLDKFDLDYVFIVRDSLLLLLGIFEKMSDYTRFEKILQELNDLTSKTYDYQKKPIIRIWEWRYALFSKQNYQMAENFFQEAKIFAKMINNSYLIEQIEKQWQSDLQDYFKNKN